MNKIIILLKREYWEHRSAFFILPMIITGVLIVIMGLVFIGTSINVTVTQIENNPSQTIHMEGNSSTLVELLGPQIEQFGTQPIEAREHQLNRIFLYSAVIFYVTLWFVVQFYLLGCLFQDRKDRSVLFWKSMPVSDFMTVTSKLITALIVVPFIYLDFLVVLQIALLLGFSVLAMPYEINIWANLVARWFGYVGYILLSAIWCLPLYGWLILVSAWAKSVPLAWVTGIPVLLVILEAVFTNSSLGRHFIMQHIFLSIEDYGLWMMTSLQMLSAITLGTIFIVLTIIIRGRANEI